MSVCPLCSSPSISEYHQDKKRSYLHCEQCQLVFVPERFHLSQNDEKAEYDKHQNSPADLGYQKFLSRTTEPLFERLKDAANGLDFGCGPGPTISVMANSAGFEMENYDFYYFNNPSLLERQYQFITMTEVIEHIAHPSKLLLQLDNLLEKGGILAIMTKRVSSQQAFATWHYKNDPTHISFYSDSTFEWIAQKMNWTLEVIDKDVVFFTKIED